MEKIKDGICIILFLIVGIGFIFGYFYLLNLVYHYGHAWAIFAFTVSNLFLVMMVIGNM